MEGRRGDRGDSKSLSVELVDYPICYNLLTMLFHPAKVPLMGFERLFKSC